MLLRGMWAPGCLRDVPLAMATIKAIGRMKNLGMRCGLQVVQVRVEDRAAVVKTTEAKA